MKKLILCILYLFLWTGPALAQEISPPMFDSMRTVILVQPSPQGDISRYMILRLKEPFRLPYYEQLETSVTLPSENISITSLRQLAQKYNADLLLVPIVKHWSWQQYYLFAQDEMIAEYTYHLAIYAYDRQKDTLNIYSTRNFSRDEASVLNQPQEILRIAMDQLLKELPYKRIPTDIKHAAAAS
jgi:hypothetical protein